MDAHTAAYGSTLCVNLIDRKKNELRLGEHFELLVNTLKRTDVKFNWFDFHKECSKMRWSNISLLMDQIKNDIDSHGAFKCSIKDKILVEQN